MTEKKVIPHLPIPLIIAIALIVIEALLASLQVDALTIGDGPWAWFLGNTGYLLRWLIVTTAVFFSLLLFHQQKGGYLNVLEYCRKFSFLRAAAHLLCYGGFFIVTLYIFGEGNSLSTLSVGLWILLGLLTALSWVYLFFVPESLWRFMVQSHKLLLLSAVMAIAILLLTQWAGSLWEPLSWITINGSYALLVLFFDTVIYDLGDKILGANDFVVHIAPVCSGLEGLVISTSVTALYLFVLRHQLKFPMALILIPCAAILSILFNIVRIAALISIGNIAPDLALGGFHSVAGWIAAIIVTFIIIFGFSSLDYFYQSASTDQPLEEEGDTDGDLAWAILVPFILVLLATLVTMIFSQGFNYWYPLKAIAGGLGLWIFWKTFQLTWPKRWLEPVAVGALVAILWVLMYPADPDFNQDFQEALLNMPLWALILWTGFRILGAWLVIPLVEELVFRGYLMARASAQPIQLQGPLPFSWLALLLSSVVFGLIHSVFLAGLVAGLLFAYVRYRGKGIMDAILAHSVANILVSIWAVLTGQWVLL